MKVNEQLLEEKNNAVGELLERMSSAGQSLASMSDEQLREARKAYLASLVKEQGSLIEKLNSPKGWNDLTEALAAASRFVSNVEKVMLDPVRTELLGRLKSWLRDIGVTLTHETEEWFYQCMIGAGRDTLEELKEKLDYIQVHSKSLTEQRLRPFTRAVTNELVQLKNLERKVDNLTVWVDSLTQTILQATELQKVIVSIGRDAGAEYGATPGKEIFGKFLGIVDVTLERLDSQATSFGKSRDVWRDARESVEREWKNLTPKCIALSQQYKELISTAKPLVVKAIDDWSVKTFSDLTSQLEKITDLVGRVIGSQQILNDIEENALSVSEGLQKLPTELSLLRDKIVHFRQGVAGVQLSSTLGEYCDSLEALRWSYSDWLSEVEQLHGRWSREAGSWLSIAKREATSLVSKLAGKIGEVEKFIIRQGRFGKLIILLLDIEGLVDQLRKELRKKLTPEQIRLLEILTDLEAKTGSINITDVEESFGELETKQLSDLLVLSKKKLVSFRVSTKEESLGT